jgi:DNA-directed RNA polymerase specialized sigma subunit
MAEEKQKKPKKRKNYLNNKDLYAQVVKSQEAGVMSDELAKMLQTLTEKYGRSGRYIGYTYNEDMQAYAMMMLCKTWHKFDPNKYTNAFAYYTTCVHNSFNQFLNKEKAQRDIRDELLLKQGLNPSHTYLNDHASDKHYVDDEEDHGTVVKDISDMVDMPDAKNNQ